MSAITNPVPSPIEAPKQPAQAPLSPRPESSRGKWILGLVVLSVIGIAAYKLLSPASGPKVSPVAAIRTAKVTTGPLATTLRVGGQTAARNFANITGPRSRGPEANRPMIIEKLAAAGAWVQPKEVVAMLDATTLKDHIDDVKATVVESELDIRKRKAEQELEMENLRQSLRVAKSELDKAKLDYSAAEIRASIDQELLKLMVEEAEARYKQLQADVAEKQKAQAAELRILDLTRERHVRHLNRHVYDFEKFTIRSPMPGLAVRSTIVRSGELVQIDEGDQIGPGQPLMKIVDPKSMQVEATVNQAESSLLRIGQEARVFLDAFPGLELKGKVYSIGALAVSGSRREQYFVRTVPVRIQIEGQDPRLIPDLSASAEIIISEVNDAVIAPLNAIREEDGKKYVLVRKGEGFERREVETGIRNNTHIAVLAGLRSGEEVRLYDR
jgi:hypothetical protein